MTARSLPNRVDNYLEDYLKLFFGDKDTKAREVYINCPIKLMSSVPVERDQSICLNESYSPILARSDNAEPSDRLILTVGGAEHNRYLARLISARQSMEFKGPYLGLMDNSFHMERAFRAGGSFLIGINQPVSAFHNSLFVERVSSGGESVASDAVMIAFKLHGNYVISLVGMSAFASRLLQDLIVTRIGRFGKKSGLFKTITQLPSPQLAKFKTDDELTSVVRYSVRGSIQEIETGIYSLTDGMDSFSFMQVCSRKQVSELNDYIEDQLVQL